MSLSSHLKIKITFHYNIRGMFPYEILRNQCYFSSPDVLFSAHQIFTKVQVSQLDGIFREYKSYYIIKNFYFLRCCKALIQF